MKKNRPRTDPSPTSGLEGIRRAMVQGWRPPVADLVGFKLTEVRKGRAKIELEAGHEHENPMGTTHGGIICDIADAAMGMSYASLLLPDESFTTVELKVNFLRPFWRGRLVASGKVIKKGRLIGLVECRVTDEKVRLVAYATSTCLTLRAANGEGLARPRREAVPES